MAKEHAFMAGSQKLSNRCLYLVMYRDNGAGADEPDGVDSIWYSESKAEKHAACCRELYPDTLYYVSKERAFI